MKGKGRVREGVLGGGGGGGVSLGWGGVYGFQFDHFFPHPMNLVALKFLKITTNHITLFPDPLFINQQLNVWGFGLFVCLVCLRHFALYTLYVHYATS